MQAGLSGDFDSYINSLRRKIEVDPKGLKIIQKDDLGYRYLKPPVSPGPDSFLLSNREMTVLQSLAVGMPRREIAAYLNLSFGIVKTHVQHIYQKLGATNLTEALAYARDIGLLN